jgi:hypothetical protein
MASLRNSNDQPLFAIRLKSPRQPRGLNVSARGIALRAGHAGAATSASVRTFPWLVGMVFAHPACVFAAKALHRPIMGDCEACGELCCLPWDFFCPMCTSAPFFPHRKAQDKSITARLVAFIGD